MAGFAGPFKVTMNFKLKIKPFIFFSLCFLFSYSLISNLTDYYLRIEQT